MSPVRKKIAIIGSGISGMGAASILHAHHDITVFEKENYIGGHSRTVEANTDDGVVPVDTGFIVFNDRNYPLLNRLFRHFNVPTEKSDMSFGASIHNGWLEYGTGTPFSFFAQWKNIFRPCFWGMIRDVLKFNKNAVRYLSKDPSLTLSDCLDDLKMGKWFREYFLLPMGGAIWSTPLQEMLRFPACTFVRFFQNHGLLTINDHPQWYTVKGGSKEYITRVTAAFKDRIHLNRAVRKIYRDETGVQVEDIHGHSETFDEVVFACHADHALAMITDANKQETEILSAFKYQPNRVVLHTDTTLMPKNRKAWASWIYLSEGKNDTNNKVSLSYWMNNLQPLNTSKPIIATLNPGREPAKENIINDHIFEHPVFDEGAIRNQSNLDVIQGHHRLWFCGGYQRYGFHEDGLGSAVKMAEKMGIEPEW